MDEKKDLEIIKQYIYELFSNTRDGKMTITYETPHYTFPCTLTYTVDWTREDADNIIARYTKLFSIICRLAVLREELKSTENRQKLLSRDELLVWKSFIRNFAPFEVSEAAINELYRRGEFDELDEEENELLERYQTFREAEALERLPYKRCSPLKFIVAAKRVEAFIALGAHESVIISELRTLAEEMILYYHKATKDTKYSFNKFIDRQKTMYPVALEEIRRGKKECCWMWYIFPQLRGLGASRKSFVFGLRDDFEARAFLDHPILGTRLLACCEALLMHTDKSAEDIFGKIDAEKLRSSLTLFASVSEKNSIFDKLLSQFFGGKKDIKTLNILRRNSL